jgi:hypothetical protein
MKKLLQYINLKDLITNVAGAAIILTLVACGGGNLNTIMNPIINAGTRVAHLITLPASGHRIVPSNSGKPFLAAMFQTSAPTPSQISQSYDVACDLDLATTPQPGSLIPLGSSNSGTNGLCRISTTNPNPQSDSGKPTYFDGTLSTLVATAQNGSIQCRDVTNTLAIADNSFTAAYLDATTHQVKVFNQGPNGTVTQVPFVCNGIGTDASPLPQNVEVQFTKQ